MYDGENASSRLLGNYTRDDMLGQVINSTSNRLWLEFNSNASGTNQGFRLTYTSELFEQLPCVLRRQRRWFLLYSRLCSRLLFPHCCQKLSSHSLALML